MAEDTFLLKIITPERVFFEGDVKMVEFNTTEGEIGIYKNHVPMTVIVQPGILTITEEDEVKKAALHSGFVEILQDKVTILAEVIEWPDEIDVERATAAKERAQSRIDGKDESTNMDRAAIALMRAIVRISAKG